MRYLLNIFSILVIANVASANAADLAKNPLGIAEVISAVRDELEKSKELLKGKGLNAMLFADEFELELQFIVKKSAGVEGFNIEVLGVGFGADAKNVSEKSEIQKIKLTFKARDSAYPDGIPPVGGPDISGLDGAVPVGRLIDTYPTNPADPWMRLLSPELYADPDHRG